MQIVLQNATVVTAARCGTGTVTIEGDRIRSVMYNDDGAAGVCKGRADAGSPAVTRRGDDAEGSGKDIVLDLRGKLLFAGGIDAHVHFREPGMIRKATMENESRAAVLGGITSFIDMPNTRPATTSLPLVEEKTAIAKEKSCANYGFHLGATNGNTPGIEAAVRQYPELFGGIKVFMGSSTGDMLVDEESVLERIFRIKGKPILVHSEDEQIIRANLKKAVEKYGDNIPVSEHPQIRSHEACVRSTRKALQLAVKNGTSLHLLHISTEDELTMIEQAKRDNPNITAETSINYLWFCDSDYERLQGRIKCNPAIKSAGDRKALIEAVRNGCIDTIGSDHAPHLEQEKSAPYRDIPSGIPSIQQTLPVLLTLAAKENIPLSRIASMLSERPAEIFGIRDRGRIAEGYFADIVIVDPEREWTVTKEELESKCRWTPYEGARLKGAVETVLVGGEFVVRDGRIVDRSGCKPEEKCLAMPAGEETTPAGGAPVQGDGSVTEREVGARRLFFGKL